MAGHGRGPLKALLAPLFAVLPAAMGGNIRRRSLTTTQGHPLASLGWTRHDHLITSGVLGDDATRHFECVLEEVDMLALVRAPFTMLGLHAHAPLARLAAGLWLDVLALPPQRGLG
jgi:hypothetical protein